jgi:hypothetical protein
MKSLDPARRRSCVWLCLTLQVVVGVVGIQICVDAAFVATTRTRTTTTRTSTRRTRTRTHTHTRTRTPTTFALRERPIDSDTVSKSGIPYSPIIQGIDELFPPQGLDQRIALSRKDGYWPFIQTGDEPPQELVYGEFDVTFFAKVLDRAGELLGAEDFQDHVFCDLGSGTGRLVLTAAALHPWKLCRGIELLPGIHEQAEGKLEECCRRPASGSASVSATTVQDEGRPVEPSVRVESRQVSSVEESYWKQYQQYTSYTPSDDWLNQVASSFDDDHNDEQEIHDDEIDADVESTTTEESNLSEYAHTHALTTANGQQQSLAPVYLKCGSFDDPYEFFGDATVVFVFSSAMPYPVMINLARAVGRQCVPGTLVITTEYQLPLGGAVEPVEDDPDMPHGAYELELVEALTGDNDSTGGLSTVFIHRVIKSLGDMYGHQPRTKPQLTLSEVAFNAIQELENGESENSPQTFLRNVSNQMAFIGLPDSWRPTLPCDEDNEEETDEVTKQWIRKWSTG